MNSSFLSGLALLLSLASSTIAQGKPELGRMWTFENPPLAYFERAHGFRPDQKWLDSLRLGSLRLGGEDIDSGFGSASFVSPRGLIMTSSRCVRDAVAATRSAGRRARGRDQPGMIKTGFVAAAWGKEIRLRTRRAGWLSAAQLVEISDVTDEVNKGVAASDDATRIKQKRQANKKAILDAARRANPNLVPQIVSLYQGAVVRLYKYKMYDDVRLVCLPHLQTAHFGGAPDNFAYPRHRLDFAFLRAYEDGKPVDTTKHYLKWKPGGAQKNELVFASGNPGTTKRLFTRAQLDFERDIRIPMKVEWLANRLRIYYKEYFDVIRERQSIATLLLGLENGLKAARGNMRALRDSKFVARKAAGEQAFRARVKANTVLAKEHGDLWDRIANVIQDRRELEARAQFHTTGSMVPLSMALTVVQSCDPAASDEHRRHAKKELETWGTGGFPNHVAFALFEDHVARARAWLPKDDPLFTKVLAGKSAADLFAGGKVHSLVPYAERRNALVESGWKAVQASEDSLIVAARELAVLIRKNQKLGDELDAKEEALGAELGRALLACYGTELAADGTRTLRFTDGVVKGYASGGAIVPHCTTFYGLYARNAKFDNESPVELPKIWLDREEAIDMTKSVNFVSTNDIIGGDMVFEADPRGGHVWRDCGGHSGSVVVNKALEVVGLVVDGNLESLSNQFSFTNDAGRTVSVHVDGIMEALVKIYGAHRVAKELTGKQ